MAAAENHIPFKVIVTVGSTTSQVEGYINGENQWVDLTERQITDKVKASFASVLAIVLKTRRKAPRP